MLHCVCVFSRNLPEEALESKEILQKSFKLRAGTSNATIHAKCLPAKHIAIAAIK